jgi:hypothetical protein
MTRTRIAILLTLVFAASAIPIAIDSELGNYGVKQRPIGQAIVSQAVSEVPLLQEHTYQKMEEYAPYAHAASKEFGIPANVLLAILYEEGIHRKPVDVTTYGPAQLGMGELELHGLPPDRTILQDPYISIWLLGSKLRRLQNTTGSLRTAIALHNGYSDYHNLVRARAKDPRLLMILEGKTFTNNLLV